MDDPQVYLDYMREEIQRGARQRMSEFDTQVRSAGLTRLPSDIRRVRHDACARLPWATGSRYDANLLPPEWSIEFAALDEAGVVTD